MAERETKMDNINDSVDTSSKSYNIDDPSLFAFEPTNNNEVSDDILCLRAKTKSRLFSRIFPQQSFNTNDNVEFTEHKLPINSNLVTAFDFNLNDNMSSNLAFSNPFYDNLYEHDDINQFDLGTPRDRARKRKEILSTIIKDTKPVLFSSQSFSDDEEDMEHSSIANLSNTFSLMNLDDDNHSPPAKLVQDNIFFNSSFNVNTSLDTSLDRSLNNSFNNSFTVQKSDIENGNTITTPYKQNLPSQYTLPTPVISNLDEVIESIYVPNDYVFDQCTLNHQLDELSNTDNFEKSLVKTDFNSSAYDSPIPHRSLPQPKQIDDDLNNHLDNVFDFDKELNCEELGCNELDCEVLGCEVLGCEDEYDEYVAEEYDLQDEAYLIDSGDGINDELGDAMSIVEDEERYYNDLADENIIFTMTRDGDIDGVIGLTYRHVFCLGQCTCLSGSCDALNFRPHTFLFDEQLSQLMGVTGNLRLKLVQFINQRTAKLVTIPQICCRYGLISLLSIVIKFGVDVNFKDENGVSPLSLAAGVGYPSAVELLLKNDADVHVTDSDGLTPMCYAVRRGNDVCVDLLLEAGASIDRVDENLHSYLHIAAGSGNISLTKVLLKNNANINATDLSQRTPLYIATEYGQSNTALLLLDAGAEVKVADIDDITCLHWAICGCSDHIIKRLIDANADLNVPTYQGDTPVHWAVENDRTRAVALLLHNKANPYLNDSDGKSIFDLASSKSMAILLDKLVPKQT